MILSQHVSEEEQSLFCARPPLWPSSSSNSSTLGYGSTDIRSYTKNKASCETKLVNQDDVPEDAAVGRNLGWTSAVMMIFSRMIGSGVCLYREA